MAKHPQVFQPKIIVHQSGMSAGLYTPSSPYSAFSPTKAKSSYSSSPRSTYSSLCRGTTGISSYTSSISNSQSNVQASNTLLHEYYYQAFRTGFPSLLDQCHPFSERKSSTKRFVCNYHGCGKMFGRNEEKTRHEKIHSGVKPYACELCSKRFGRKDHLTQHMRTHNRGRREEGRRDENDKNSRNQQNNKNNKNNTRI